MDGKTVVILGGGSGIGRAGALALAQAGCAILVADIDEEAARATAAAIERAGGTAVFAYCDLGSESDVAAVAALACQKYQHVDIVWCHAGYALAGPPESIPIRTWQNIFDVNVLSTVRALHAFLPDLTASRGHFVVTSSGLGLFPDDVPGLAAPYVVTKAAQIALARNLAPYLAARNVGISVLAPDQTNTRHAREISTVGIPAAVVAAAVDPSTMQTPEYVASRLVGGLRADEFLISTVEGTRERLTEAAARNLSPLAEPVEPIVLYVRIEADSGRHDELAQALIEWATQVVKEPGVIRYQVTADLVELGVFHLLEEWESARAFQQHNDSPGAQAVLARMAEFGIAGLFTRRYDISGIDGTPVKAQRA
ncbi:SDR family NAD(P)-dependent oxidoreductase [Nocardia sp. NPDC051900]|uniref:SDR family NAD(P)-dependent oxidoreductase n=1 Tax=Nocardia sp. NPDC051900 TaxID=3364326 RepID=UPI0037BDAE7E